MNKYILNVNFTANMDIEVEADNIEDAIFFAGREYYYIVQPDSKIEKELSHPEGWKVVSVEDEGGKTVTYNATMKEVEGIKGIK